MRLLLTGATGFVGRNFLRVVASRYEQVILPVRDRGKLERQLEVDGVDPASLEVCEVSKLTERGSFGVDHVVHAAATLFGRSRSEIFATNVGLTEHLLSALRGRPRIVFLSSQSAGGNALAPGGALCEDDPDRPLTWYGESKLAAEQRIRARFPESGVRILRPPMVLGPRDRATLPLFAAARGAVWLKPGLYPKRYSWISVSDLVRAIRLVLEADHFVRPFYYVAAPDVLTDRRLLETAGRVVGTRRLMLPIPEPGLRLASRVIDALPPLRAALPSLTRDRARELWVSDMVVDGSSFGAAFGFRAEQTLESALGDVWSWLCASPAHRESLG